MTTRTSLLKAVESANLAAATRVVSANLALTFHVQLFGRLCRAGRERRLDMHTGGIGANGLVAGQVEKDPASDRPVSWHRP